MGLKVNAASSAVKQPHEPAERSSCAAVGRTACSGLVAARLTLPLAPDGEVELTAVVQVEADDTAEAASRLSDAAGLNEEAVEVDDDDECSYSVTKNQVKSIGLHHYLLQSHRD